MTSREQQEAERLEILHEMGSITRMRRGTVNEQYIKTRRKNGRVVENGPYYIYSRTEKGKSVSKRIPKSEVKRYREETENCRRFKELSMRCVLACEALTDKDNGSWKKKRPRQSKNDSVR